MYARVSSLTIDSMILQTIKVKLICLSFFNFFFILSLRKEETCSIEDLTFNLKSGQSDFFLKTL